MREVVPGIVGLIGLGAGVATLALWIWVFIHVYAEVDRRDANSWWLIISTRYRRLVIAVAALYVLAGTALVSATILQKYLR
jgi:hypothetical protein